MLDSTYIEIKKDNLKNNINCLLNNCSGFDYYIGVVKANVYGHGYESIKYMLESGINYLAISNIFEAREVRRLYRDIAVLCLEPIEIDHLHMCEGLNVAVTVESYNYARMLVESNKQVRVHLKVNSGMNRLGINNKIEFKKTYDYLVYNNIEVEGVFSHFATSGIDDDFYEEQIKNFKEIVSLVSLSKFKMVHMDRSLTSINHSKIDICNAIRLGIVMYGYDLTPCNKKNEYKQVLSLYSKIRSINFLEANQGVGYGNVCKTNESKYIAILPIGYKDGFLTKNNNGRCYIKNKFYKILQVNMCMTIIEVDGTVNENDLVELIGNNVRSIEVSKRCETIVYETICLLKNNIKRIISGEENE